MSDDLHEPDPGILVARKPIDLGNTIEVIDAFARAEALAILSKGGASPLASKSTRPAWQRFYARELDNLRYSIRTYVPPDEGEGYWDIYRVSDQIFVMLGECRYKRAKWIGVPGESCFKIRYLRSGHLRRANGETLLRGPGAMFEVYPSRAGDGYHISADTSCALAIIQCANSVLMGQLGVDPSQAPKPLRLLMQERADPYAETFEPTKRISDAFADIFDCRYLYGPNLRVWFVEAKAKEIISTLLHYMMQEPSFTVGGNRIGRRDRHRIHEAKEIILGNLERVPTIPQLARMIGTNETKLKAAFKRIVGSTIGEFVLQQRMDLAVRMLTTTELDISQIGHSLGYRYSGNFTQAFRRYFGRSPRIYRRQSSATTRMPCDGADQQHL